MFKLLSRVAAIVALSVLAACGGSDGTSPSASSPSPVTQSFKLGGSVNGLTDTGLVLANGTDSIAVAANATSFSLGAVLTAGAPYAVSVLTQPANGVCSIANGSGITSSADVGNVVVTCSTQAFALGGSVSGLTATGLVLVNGSDTVVVPATATAFILPMLVASGSSYTVTVQSQPAGEACSVTSGSATMPAQAIASIAVACTDQPFSLGGTITGLTTSGLVIADGITITGLTSTGLVIANGMDTVAPPVNAATFALPTPIDYHSPYALLVATQPTGLMCSFSSSGNVAASSGSMPAGNVTTTALVCSPQFYALGGNVTGLVGSIALADGADSVTVNAAGPQSFTLPTPVAYGTQYALTVPTQPSGLTCTPGSNSAGSMPAGAVSVTVTCSPLSYTLGGSISNLTSTGLVLANGSSNTVSSAAGASQFTLPDGIAFDSTYAVTAWSQPQGQTCAVTSNSGTMPAANVNSVQVACYANTFTTAGGPYSWTVPPGVTSIQVVAIGGGGGGSGTCCSTDNNVAGNGALVTGTLSVQPGDVLAIYVGGGGQAIDEGGGGGGLTYVGDGATNFLIAGGGGGAGGGPGVDANGGNAGSPGASYGIAAGGGAGSNGTGGSAGTGGQQTLLETPGSAFTDTATPGSGSGGIGGGCCIGSGGGSGISSTIGNGGSGGSGYGAGGGGGGYGGGGGGADGGNSGGSAGGGGGGSTGPNGTTFAVAPGSGPGAGGRVTLSGTGGSVVIEIL